MTINLRYGFCRLLIALTLVVAGAGAGLAAPAGGTATAVSPVTISEEIELGNKVAGEMQRRYPAWRNADQERRVRRIAMKLFEVSDRHESSKLRQSFTVDLLDTKVINAFCAPGGRTFVTRGLIDLGVDDDELACVMGHEIAHAARRHGARNLEANKILQSRINQMTKRSSLRTLAQIPILFYMCKRFSPQLEYEADYYGVIYAARAGFDPDGLARLLARFEKLEARQRSSKLAQLLTSLTDNHPPTPDRVKRASDLTSRIKHGETPSTTAVPVYD